MQAGPWNNWIRPVCARESEGEEESGRGECGVRRGVLHFGQTTGTEVDGGAENGVATADVRTAHARHAGWQGHASSTVVM